MVKHELAKVIPTNAFSGAPGYVAQCYCGRWSKKFDEDWRAQRAIEDHIKDKNAHAKAEQDGTAASPTGGAAERP